MRDTEYNGRVQRMYTVVRRQKVEKGMKAVLEERGINTAGKNAQWMHKELASHPDLKHEMNMTEHFLRQKGHICVFLPKFHLELNAIERVWAQLKRFKGH